MLSGQCVPHTLHPYTPTKSHSRRGNAHTLPYSINGKIHPSGNTVYAATLASSPDLQKQVRMSETGSTSDAEILPPTQSSHLSSFERCTESITASKHADSSIHFPNSTTTTRDSRNTVRTSTQPNPTCQLPNFSSTVQNIFRFLQSWRPPVEYYAHRRHLHASLIYPSRRPTIPTLLEERFTHDGKLAIVCPELAASTSLRAYRRKIFPIHVSHAQWDRQRPASDDHSQDWIQYTDEDIDMDFANEDESVGSEDDFDEAVTPINSPPSNRTYLLQPLVLTKPHGS